MDDLIRQILIKISSTKTRFNPTLNKNLYCDKTPWPFAIWDKLRSNNRKCLVHISNTDTSLIVQITDTDEQEIIGKGPNPIV